MHSEIKTANRENQRRP